MIIGTKKALVVLAFDIPPELDPQQFMAMASGIAVPVGFCTLSRGTNVVIGSLDRIEAALATLSQAGGPAL